MLKFLRFSNIQDISFEVFYFREKTSIISIINDLINWIVNHNIGLLTVNKSTQTNT